ALSGTPRAHAIDRWIFVFMAAWFILIVLTGFIPDSIAKVGAVQAGQRPPFPIVLHMHAVVMGSFLVLLLTQSVLMSTGRRPRRKRGLAQKDGVPGYSRPAAGRDRPHKLVAEHLTGQPGRNRSVDSCRAVAAVRLGRDAQSQSARGLYDLAGALRAVRTRGVR